MQHRAKIFNQPHIVLSSANFYNGSCIGHIKALTLPLWRKKRKKDSDSAIGQSAFHFLTTHACWHLKNYWLSFMAVRFSWPWETTNKQECKPVLFFHHFNSLTTNLWNFKVTRVARQHLFWLSYLTGFVDTNALVFVISIARGFNLLLSLK